MAKRRGKRLRDKTSITGVVDFPFLVYRENRKNTRSLMGKTFRPMLRCNDFDEFKSNLNALWQSHRGYLGFMTGDEAFDQAMSLPEDTYFIYSIPNDARWKCVGKTDIIFEYSYNDMQMMQNDEEIAHLKILDRSDALIFQKKLRKWMRIIIDCWSIIGRRLRIVKDIRIMIAKMLWVNKWEWVP
jgi:hypothetical protein